MYEVGDKVVYQGADKRAYKRVGTLKRIEEKDGKPQLTVEFDDGETFTAPVDDWSKEFTNAARNAKFKVGDKVEVHTTTGGEINAHIVIKGTVARLDNGYGMVVVDYKDPWGYQQQKFCKPSEIVKVLPNSVRSTNSVVANACKNAQFKIGDIVGLKTFDGGRRDYVVYDVLSDSYRVCYADNFGVGCERVQKGYDGFVDKHRTMKVPNACTPTNSVVRNAIAANRRVARNAIVKNSAYTNYKNFKLMKASAEAELGGLIRSIMEAGNNIANDARGFKNVSGATELEKGYIDTCVSKCEKALREVKERLERQLDNVMQ